MLNPKVHTRTDATQALVGNSLRAGRRRRASKRIAQAPRSAKSALQERFTWSPLDSADLLANWRGPPQEEKPPLKVTFGGAGIFFWWELGAVLWLSENYDMSKVPMAGASGGALAATLAACNVDPYKAAQVADRLGKEYNIWERPLGLMGVWGDIIRVWLDELLPENAADLCRDRVEVVVTTLPLLKLDTVSDYKSKEDLIDANLASAHVPLFLDGQMMASLRGKMCFDGSFHDFLQCSNSCFLTCDGDAVLFDYFQDEELKFDRFDFLSLKNYDEVMRLMEMGYAFAEKKYSRGEFDKFDTSSCAIRGLKFNKLLGMIRRNTPQLLEV
ncbi:hypothetical protein BSKO_05530 [Bryopsis sp. KO-2023]|nr:hypothetical protein BSKO_05530 [Bryopsis sp. KO-2023]